VLLVYSTQVDVYDEGALVSNTSYSNVTIELVD